MRPATTVYTDDSTGALAARVLHTLALTRTGTMHFPHYFVGPRAVCNEGSAVKVELHTGLYCLGADGQVETGALGVMLDIALGRSVRLGARPPGNIALSNLHLSFTGRPLLGHLVVQADFCGRLNGTFTPMARAEVTVTADGEQVCSGSGVYVLTPTPTDQPRSFREIEETAKVAPLDPRALDPDELALWRRTRRILSLSGTTDFVRQLWGFRTRSGTGRASGLMAMGLHVSNISGKAQGGILCGFAATTAAAAVPGCARLIDFSAAYLSPGQGTALRSTATASHVGRRTATVRTTIRGADGRTVLEALTMHARDAQ